MAVAIGHVDVGGLTADETVAVSGLEFAPKAILIFGRGGVIPGSGSPGASNVPVAWAASTAEGSWSVCYATDAGASVTGPNRSRRLHTSDALTMLDSTASDTEGRLALQSLDADGFTLQCAEGTPAGADENYLWLAIGGPDVQVKVGSLTEPSATGLQSVSNVGFRPDLLLLASAGTASSIENNSRVSYGWCARDLGQSVWSGGLENGVQENVGRYSRYCRTGDCIAMLSSDLQSLESRASVSAWQPMGFRLNWHAVEGSGANVVHYLAIKGVDCVSGSFATDPTLNNTVTVTGLPFQPAAVMLQSHTQQTLNEAGVITTAAGAGGNVIHALGAFTNPSNRRSAYTHHGYVSGSFADRRVRNSNVACLGLQNALFDVASVDESGFTIITDAADSVSRNVPYLAIGSELPPEQLGNAPWYGSPW